MRKQKTNALQKGGTSMPSGANRELGGGERFRILAQGLAPVLIALTIGIGPAKAELIASPEVPAFSEADRATIDRNETLKSALPKSPWLVFRILRALEQAQQETRGTPLDVHSLRHGREFDPRHDPDMDAMQRTEPEAAHDLFVLLKKAGNGGGAKK